MHFRNLLCSSLLLIAGGLVGGDRLAYAGDLRKQGFGEKRSGLAMRIRKAHPVAGASPLVLLIEVELRAVGGKAVPLSEPFTPKLIWQSEDGKPLPEGIRVLRTRSPLDRAGASVRPGKPLKWTVPLLRTSEKAPQKLKVRGAITQLGPMRYGTLPLSSGTLELDWTRVPLPKALEKRHLAAGWTPATTLVYHLYQGLFGWRMLEVRPDGVATVFRSKVHGDASARGAANDLPPGTFTAPLTATELAGLAPSFVAQQVWTLDDLPKRMLIPDESSATFTLIAGAAALFARYPIAEAEKANAKYAAFQAELDALMQRIVKRAQKGTR